MSDDDIKIDIHEDPNQKVIDDLIIYLKNRGRSMNIYSDCHEYLCEKYSLYYKILVTATLICISISFLLATIGKKVDCEDNSPNIPWLVLSAIIMLLKGYQTYTNYSKLSKSHETDHKLALNISEEIEVILLKNSHTKHSLKKHVDNFEEQIRLFQKHETPLPIVIKHKFLNKN